jgi:asparagine synthetase B (glutamine-hydrolysing)
VGHSGTASWREHGWFFLEGHEHVSRHAGAAELGFALAEHDFSERLRLLPGDFSFASFGPDHGVRLVRGAAGAVPLYLWQAAGAFAFVTRLGDLARFLPHELELEPLVNATCCTMFGWLGDRRTFLKGVSELRMGECAVQGAATWEVRTWWDPSHTKPERPTLERTTEHARRLKDLLLRNLERAFSSDAQTLMTLSGGVDSSSLVAIAALSLGASFSTLSFVPPDEPHHTNARRRIDALRAECGPRIARHWEFDHSARGRLALVEGAPREVFQVPNPALCVLPMLNRATRIGFLVGGELCDDLFGSALIQEDWDVATSARDLLAQARELPGGLRTVLGWLRRRARIRARRAPLHRPEDLPGFILPELRREYRALLYREREGLARDPRPRAFIAKRLEVAHTAIGQNHEVASALGIRRVFPFLSRDLVTLAFECHPSEGMIPGTKKLLRRALRGMVPDSHLMQNKEGWSEPGDETRWAKPLPAELSSMIRPDWLERPPERLDVYDALRLTLLLNICGALRTARTQWRANNRA